MTALFGEDGAIGVIRFVDVCLVNLRVQVIVRKKLIIACHPVAKSEINDRGKLELVENVFAKAFIIHGW